MFSKLLLVEHFYVRHTIVTVGMVFMCIMRVIVLVCVYMLRELDMC